MPSFILTIAGLILVVAGFSTKDGPVVVGVAALVCAAVLALI